MAWLRLLWAREDFNTKKVGMHFWKTPSVSKEGFVELSWLGLCWCRDRTGRDRTGHFSSEQPLCQPRTAGGLFQAKPSGWLRAPAHPGQVPWDARAWGASPCPHTDAKWKMTVQLKESP